MTARLECYWRLRNDFLWLGTQSAWSQIGRWMNRDHSTVLHGAQRYAATRAS